MHWTGSILTRQTRCQKKQKKSNDQRGPFTSVWFKFSRGAGVVTPWKPPPPTNNFCLYPPPILRCIWKDPLMTPTPHHPTSSIFHCYPPTPSTTPYPYPLKILIIHLDIPESKSPVTRYYTVIWSAAVRYLIYLARESRYWAKNKLSPISVFPCQISQILGKQQTKQLFYFPAQNVNFAGNKRILF